MIWSRSAAKEKGGYVVFRKTCELADAGSPARLQVFADSRYLLWINGRYVLRGPCRFNPKRPEYDVVDVQSYLRKGTNVLVVMVHHYGNAINGRIMKHAPGLGAILEIAGKEVLRTDSTWRCNDSTMYLPSPESWNTIPDVIDARIDQGGWITADCDDTAWSRAKAIDGGQWGRMFATELPLRKETVLRDLRVLPSGEPLHSRLPLVLSAGEEVLVDFGTMAMAYTTMDVEGAEGSTLSMTYALRYKDGKPFESYGSGSVYTAGTGRHEFMTTDQWGSHYMLVKCSSGRFTIHGIGIIDRRYPYERIGSFACSDTVLGDLWDMAVKTIEVTSDDCYGSDARERNEWIQDASKPSFLTSRVALSERRRNEGSARIDVRLLKSMLRHAALSQLPDGRLLATFPTDRGPEDCHYVIEDYSCQWFEALKMYYDITGDKAFVREVWPTLVAQLQWFLARRTSRGLLMAREYGSFDNPFAYIVCEGATVNAFFSMALRVSAELAELLGEHRSATLYALAGEDLTRAYNREFWNDKERAYNAAILHDSASPPTVHAQLMALHYGLVSDDRKADVRKWFLAHYRNAGMKHVCTNNEYEAMVRMKAGVDMPVMYYWVFSQLYEMDTDEQDREVLTEMRRRWTPMVLFQQDAGTLSESFTDEKGEGASESCHNYGATPAYFLSAYVLGVRTTGTAEDKRLLVEPRLGDLTFASGTVVTEFGPVAVSWKKAIDGRTLHFDLTIPDGVNAELHLPRSGEKYTLLLNGRDLLTDPGPGQKVRMQDRWIVLQTPGGRCAGSVGAE
jgi:hypothetical protein